MEVKDPQNPVHFALNSSIPTNMDRTNPAYGLAQLIADGPSTENLGVTNEVTEPGVAPGQLSGTTRVNPISPPPVTFGVLNAVPELPASQPAPVGASTAEQLGGVTPSPDDHPIPMSPLVYVNTGVQQLGKGP